MHTRKFINPVVVATSSAILMLASAIATHAQEAAGALEEITVTAQKREQNLQDVPIAVSVISGEAIDATGGFTIESLRQLVPSLNIRKTNTQLNQSLFLRGVGTINFAIAAQPSVGFVLDGVVLSSAGEAFGDLYDVERIEVLRGPQGTLFGKNSSAGVVNVVSKRPGEEFGGYADLSWYEDNEIRLKAALDTPVSDRLRGRTTFTAGDFDGYIDNISTTPAGGKLNGYDRWGIRSIWVADAAENIELTFIADYRESDDNCCVEVIGGVPTGGQAAALALLLSGTDNANGDESRRVRQNLVMSSEEEAWGFSAQADIGIGDYTLTSITAYRTWDSTEIREGDWLDAGAAYVGINQLHDTGPQTQDTFSQELRIASPGGETIDYVAGLYYANTSADRYFRRDTVVCRSSTLPADSTGLQPCTPAASVIEMPSADADFGAEFDNFALFADGTYNVSDRWRVIGGLRWTMDELSFDHLYNFSPIPGPGIRTQPGGGTARLSGSDDSNDLSGRGGLQFDISNDLTSYATYSRGYKGPAYNVFFNMTANNAEVIEAETADSYEIGLKSTLADGRVIVNAAAFHADYSNFQANNFLFLNNVLITTLTNAGDVSTEGVELDFLARPMDKLTISGGVAYTDAVVDAFFTPPGQPPTVRDGTKLPLAPEWKATLMGEYRIELASIDLLPSMLIVYTDDQFSDLDEPAITLIPAFTTIDLQLAILDKDNRYRLTLIGRNITDESYAALVTRGGPGGAPRLQIPRDADRYFGVQFRANFGGAQ